MGLSQTFRKPLNIVVFVAGGMASFGQYSLGIAFSAKTSEVKVVGNYLASKMRPVSTCFQHTGTKLGFWPISPIRLCRLELISWGVAEVGSWLKFDEDSDAGEKSWWKLL